MVMGTHYDDHGTSGPVGDAGARLRSSGSSRRAWRPMRGWANYDVHPNLLHPVAPRRRRGSGGRLGWRGPVCAGRDWPRRRCRGVSDRGPRIEVVLRNGGGLRLPQGVSGGFGRGLEQSPRTHRCSCLWRADSSRSGGSIKLAMHLLQSGVKV